VYHLFESSSVALGLPPAATLIYYITLNLMFKLTYT
jgi:hypothetical protein